jgi:Domain of unknown function (DUF3291)
LAMMPIVAEYQLAQINIARLRGPLDSPEMRDFIAVLAEINRLAESAPGFVWRHPSGFGHLSGADLLGDDLITINLSVWESYQPLHNFTYRSHHGSFVRRRSQWFTPLRQPTTALWWVPASYEPTPEEASPAPTLTQLRADAASVHGATSLPLPRRPEQETAGKRRY